MGALQRSLLTAGRDTVALATVALAACVYVTGRSVSWSTGPGTAVVDLSWGRTVQPSTHWTLAVLAWIVVVWLASRARAGRRTVWVPGVLAGAVVVVRAVVALGPPDTWLTFAVGAWPGPALPFIDSPDQPVALIPGHPAWAYPPLVLGLLATAAWLGARAGRLPDDPASRHVATTSGRGVAMAAAAVGLATLGAVGGAVVADLVQNAAPEVTASDQVVGLVFDLGMPLLTVLSAAALLSGTGWLGTLATVVVGWPLVVGPFQSWARGGSDLALGRAAGVAVAIAAVALWRPAAVRASEVLGWPAPSRSSQVGGAPMPGHGGPRPFRLRARP